MNKILSRKPGPKSSKQRKKIVNRGSLDESNVDYCSDDSNYGQSSDENVFQRPKSVTEAKQNSQVDTKNRSGFRTPDLDNDLTDYGLEFTTSRIQHLSPRRCSTLRTVVSSQEEQRMSPTATDIIDNSVSTIQPKQTNFSKELSKQKVTKAKSSKTQNVKQIETVEPKTVGTERKKVRKQRKPSPLQVERRFWKDVQVLQNRTDNLIPMLPFSRLVRELIQENSKEVTKITPTAMEALQTSSEMYITQRLQDAYMLTLHRGRVTLDVTDIKLIDFLKINL